jgi:hypothetical protein
LYQALKDLDYKDLLSRYYSGRKPGKIPKKVRAQLAELMPKNREHGQEVLPEGFESISTFSEPLKLPQVFQQPLLPDSWYKARAEIIRKMYPELSRHKKTKTKSWKEVYNEYLAEMSRISSLKADVIKEQNLEGSILEEAKRKMLEEE